MNATKTEGVFDQAKGKVKQAIGETFNNQELANEGAADQVKGHVKEAWGDVKDSARRATKDNTANDPRYESTATGHDVRDSITNAAANVKDSVKRGLDHLDNNRRNR